MGRVGQNHTYHIYTRCVNDFSCTEITKITVIYGVYIRFWPTLVISAMGDNPHLVKK